MRKNGSGQLYVFEGPDGVGKSSIVAAVAERLRAKGHDVLPYSFPGNQKGSLGELVYRLHHDQSHFGIDGLDPASLQALHVAAHLDAIRRSVRPAIDCGQTVLLDRYWWSTWVYGVCNGVSTKLLDHLVDTERCAWGKILPAAVFVISRQVDGHEALALRHAYDRLRRREAKRGASVVSVTNEARLESAVFEVERHIHAHLPSRTESAELRRCEQKSAVAGPFSLSVISRRRYRPSPVFDTYWRFAAERQAVFLRRICGQPEPWTEDSVILRHRFTNAYRASDRVSQFLISDVIYQGDPDPDEVLFRILIFKLFNKIETWQLLVGTLGEVRWETFDVRRYDRILSEAAGFGARLYSAAYIMPSGITSFGNPRKHQNHLRLVERMMEDEVSTRVVDAKSLEEVYQLFLSYPMMGPFLAYQMTIDVNYSDLAKFSEMDFVVPGPGARDGIAKCFEDTGGLKEAELIRMMAEEQSHHFQRLGMKFQDLWGRPLQLIDCQNLFCEVDKYARVMHPEIAGRSGRTRIKQNFKPLNAPLACWYPPKWNLNAAIKQWKQSLVQP